MSASKLSDTRIEPQARGEMVGALGLGVPEYDEREPWSMNTLIDQRETLGSIASRYHRMYLTREGRHLRKERKGVLYGG